MKYYRMTLDTISLFKRIGREWDKKGANLLPIEDVTDNTYYLDASDSVIHQYAFEIEEDCDNLQGLKVKGKTYGFVCVTLEANPKSIQEHNLEYHQKGLDYWKENTTGGRFFYQPYSREYVSKEFPYRVYLFGCDDSSFTRCYATLEDVENLLELISSEPLDMQEFTEDLQFTFTN